MQGKCLTPILSGSGATHGEATYLPFLLQRKHIL